MHSSDLFHPAPDATRRRKRQVNAYFMKHVAPRMNRIVERYKGNYQDATIPVTSYGIGDAARHVFYDAFASLPSFLGIHACEHCGCTKNTLHRAHHAGHSHVALLRDAIHICAKHADNLLPSDNVMETFLNLHRTVCIWMLCQKCHTVYDNPQTVKYSVEKIVGKRERNTRIEYRVQWKDDKTPTWEPQSILCKDIPAMIRAYERKLSK